MISNWCFFIMEIATWKKKNQYKFPNSEHIFLVMSYHL